ncbi:sensor histidine kinase [Paenibacillus sp. GCM10028914]|uniref:sensor histidine kinase n=1 Tax=Paenibacillus sp. GCM10028914 TaxID=3273416 RepID=UPI003623B89F
MIGLNVKKSLQTKFIVSFLLVITPLVAILFYSNIYGKNTITRQVSASNKNMIEMFIREADNYLQQIDMYLFNLRSNDPDIRALGMQEYHTIDYYLAKYYVYKKLKNDVAFYSKIDHFFVYMSQPEDLMTTWTDMTDEDMRKRQQVIKTLVERGEYNRWQVVPEGGASLIRIVKMDDQMYVGASLNLKSLISPLYSTKLGENSKVLFLNDQGEALAGSFLTDRQKSQLKQALSSNSTEQGDFRFFSQFEEKQDFVEVAERSEVADFHLAVMIPEKQILQAMTFFERMIAIIPAAVLIVMLIYLFLLRKFLILPMKRLMVGMKRVSRGDLNVELEEKYTGEFSFLVKTFNFMTSEIAEKMNQITHLRIDIYEEKIKAQQAEYKRLQTQINPHFYMNSLYIMYNLASVQQYETVQKIALHLASYFRFIMQHDRETVTLQEEIDHVRNYLEIQKLRFPKVLTYDIQLTDSVSRYDIPPITIQPFVENSVIHGFKDVGKPFCVTIQIFPDPERSKEAYLICVTDNGVGFAPDMLSRINAEAFLKEADGAHVGIRNVLQRLLLKHEGMEYQFSNNKEGGAEVWLRLPVDKPSIDGGG